MPELKCHGIFARGGHMAKLIQYQACHGGIVAAFEGDLNFVGHLREIGVPGQDV